jgi:phosphate-selective porin
MKLGTALAMTALMSTAAVADPAARANTADPGSAPLMRDPVVTRPANDAAARANTTDPNSAATTAGRATTGFGMFDAAGRANTSDPGSINSGATNAAGQPANPMANPQVH